MTIDELRNYLAKYAEAGYGSCDVYVCDYTSNPIADAYDIKDALFIDSKSGDCYIVLQTD